MVPPDRGSPGRPIIREPAETDHRKAVALDPNASSKAGPFESEREAAAAARWITDLEPGTGQWGVAMHKTLDDACSAAGVELGAHDHAVLLWLCGWEPSTVVTIAGWVTRARQSGGDGQGRPT